VIKILFQNIVKGKKDFRGAGLKDAGVGIRSPIERCCADDPIRGAYLLTPIWVWGDAGGDVFSTAVYTDVCRAYV
jgi:hypothetical protein